jgi:tetratricopeptide (TPR) repeat protein
LCEKSLRLDSTSPQTWDTLGHAYTYDTERKNYEKAKAYFVQALRIEPRMAIAAFHLGATYFREGKYPEAIAYLEAARNQQPEFSDTYLFLGYAYSNTGRLKEGADTLAAYLEMAPNARDAGKHEEHLAKLRAELGDQAGAVGAITVPSTGVTSITVPPVAANPSPATPAEKNPD